MTEVGSAHVALLRAAVRYGLNGLPRAGISGVDAVERVRLTRDEFDSAKALLIEKGLLVQQSGRLRVTDATLAGYPTEADGNAEHNEARWIEFIEAASGPDRV